MHPTVDEQLRGVRRLLELAAADPGLRAGSASLLADAGRQLRRLEGTWAEVLPFLVADNRATAAVLADVAPLLDADLAEEVAGAVARTGTAALTEAERDGLDVAAAAARNDELRGLLSRAIAALPEGDDPAGRRAGAAIAAHLRRRLDADPTNARSTARSSPSSDAHSDAPASARPAPQG